jgi:hypothetical protein
MRTQTRQECIFFSVIPNVLKFSRGPDSRKAFVRLRHIFGYSSTHAHTCTLATSYAAVCAASQLFGKPRATTSNSYNDGSTKILIQI